MRLYEAKLIHHYNHRFSTFDGVSPKDLAAGKSRGTSTIELIDASFVAKPRYWVSELAFNEVVSKYGDQLGWLLCYRDVARATDERTCIAAVIPFTAGTRSSPCIGLECPHDRAILAAMFSAFFCDFVARLKVPGIHLNYTILKQLPLVRKSVFESPALWSQRTCVAQWIRLRFLELTYSARDLEPFALDCGYDGPPFRWDEERRFLLRCELDAAYFHLYLGESEEWGNDNPQLREMFPTPRHAVEYIMETFPIVKRKDIKRHGDYRTKLVILDLYDQMQQAMESGSPFHSQLDPPAGPPTDSEGNFIPMADWDLHHWPSHIHPPRDPIT